MPQNAPRVHDATNEKVDFERIPFGSDPALIGKIVARDGGLILTGVLSKADVDAVNRARPLLELADQAADLDCSHGCSLGVGLRER